MHLGDVGIIVPVELGHEVDDRRERLGQKLCFLRGHGTSGREAKSSAKSRAPSRTLRRLVLFRIDCPDAPIRQWGYLLRYTCMC